MELSQKSLVEMNVDIHLGEFQNNGEICEPPHQFTIWRINSVGPGNIEIVIITDHSGQLICLNREK